MKNDRNLLTPSMAAMVDMAAKNKAAQDAAAAKAAEAKEASAPAPTPAEEESVKFVDDSDDDTRRDDTY